jgi:hypothetical protein
MMKQNNSNIFNVFLISLFSLFLISLFSFFSLKNVKHISRRKLRIKNRIYTPPSLGLPSNWSNTQKIAIVGALIATIVGSLVGANLVVNNVASTQPQGAYSYMIYQSPTFSTDGLYMVKASNGSIISSSLNAVTIFNSTINAASAIKGSVYVAQGNYPISSCINASLVNVALNSNGAYLYIPSNNPLNFYFQCIFNFLNPQNSSITGFVLDGKQALNNYAVSSPALIRMQGNCYNVNIEGNTLLNGRMYGIGITAFSGDVVSNVNVRFNTLIGAGHWNSIYYMAYDSGAGGISGCEVTGNDISGFADIGVCIGQAISGTVSNVNVHDNKIHNGTIDGSGSGGGTDSVYGIRFEGNVRWSHMQNNDIWGVRIGTACDGSNCTISGNNIRNDLVGATDSNELMGTFNFFVGNTVYGGYGNTWMHGIEVYGKNNTISFNTFRLGGTSTPFYAMSTNGAVAGTVWLYNTAYGCSATEDFGASTNQANIGNLP